MPQIATQCAKLEREKYYQATEQYFKTQAGAVTQPCPRGECGQGRGSSTTPGTPGPQPSLGPNAGQTPATVQVLGQNTHCRPIPGILTRESSASRTQVSGQRRALLGRPVYPIGDDLKAAPPPEVSQTTNAEAPTGRCGGLPAPLLKPLCLSIPSGFKKHSQEAVSNSDTLCSKTNLPTCTSTAHASTRWGCNASTPGAKRRCVSKDAEYLEP